MPLSVVRALQNDHIEWGYGLCLSAFDRNSGFIPRVTARMGNVIYHGRALPTELHWLM